MAVFKYINYQDALDSFTKIRKEMNGYIESEDYEKASELFKLLKVYAANEETVAMDVLAYYYKTGIKNVVPENYTKYIQWEIVAAARGNEFAIEKIQFLIGYACDLIMDNENYEVIEYKNDIDEYNALYVIGKNLAKVIARNMKLFPVDLTQEEDIKKPYTQEDFVNLRKIIDDAIPKTIEMMKN